MRSYKDAMRELEELKRSANELELIKQKMAGFEFSGVVDLGDGDYIRITLDNSGMMLIKMSSTCESVTPEELIELRDVLNKWFPKDGGVR